MSNTQIIEQIWQDAVKILDKHHRQRPDLALGGLPFAEVQEVMPQLLKATLEGSRRIKNITENLKTFSRSDDNDSQEMVAINQVLEFSIQMLTNEIKRCTDSFTFEPGHSIPTFKGNSRQIEQVMVNLIQNALQALPNRNCGVRITTSRDEDENLIVVTVTDEGIGMNRAIIECITDPFFTTKLDKGGTGLGLYVSYSIVKTHCASMEFDSQPGEGTTACVKFPISKSTGGLNR